MDKTCDAMVIGGGPAGSTSSAILARKGRKVILLEKEKFPRYHIGESMMPFCYFPLERSGVLEKVKKAAYTKKYSVQFVSTNGRASLPFYFFNHLKHESALTWQVRRSEFDHLLLNHSRESGAEVHEETQVKEVLRDASGKVAGVKAVGKDGKEFSVQAPMTLDCSGRDALSLARNGWRIRDPKLDKIAIWTYYEGAKRDEGLEDGATTVAFIPQKGWFWYIPLSDGTISVGVVNDKDYLFRGDTRDLETIFLREVDVNPWVKDHVGHAKHAGKFWTTGEYSYRGKHCAADGLILVGDAFAFLDPVFSSGMFLALHTGMLAADAVDEALKSGNFGAAQFTNYGKQVGGAIESMRRFVYAFYDERFRFRDLFDKYPHTRGQITDCLIGDLFKDHDPLFKLVSEFAEIPAPVAHGAPLLKN